MARYRSRRNTRRTASQTAASLLALALPAPVQRVADTRIGPLLMLVGVPTMLALGLLNIDWSNGAPNLSIDQRRASELHNVTRETLNKFDTQGGLQGLGAAASELINHAQNYANQQNNPYANSQYGQQSNPYSQPTTYTQSQYTQSQPAWPTRSSGAAFPSTQPSKAPATATQQDWRYTSQQTTAQAQQTGYAQPTYSQPAYSPNHYATNSGGYGAQAASPSDQHSAAAYQQQLYQQQLYEQQLRQQQYQLWLAQQQAAQQQPAYGSAFQQTDAYGRPIATGSSANPVNTGNWQTSSGYAAPQYNSSQYNGNQYNSSQYVAPGGVNYNQGSLPAQRGYR